MSIQGIGCTQRERNSASMHLFGVTSGLLQVVLGSFALLESWFWIVPFFTNNNLDNVLTCKFSEIELHVTFYDKLGKIIINWGSFYVLKSRESVITHRSSFFLCYKMREISGITK